MPQPTMSRRFSPWIALAVALWPAMMQGQQAVAAQRPGGTPVEPSAHAVAAIEFLPDLDVLRAAPPRLVLALPEGGQLTLETTSVEVQASGDVRWRGRVAGEGVSVAWISVRRGFAAGAMSTATRNYRIQVRGGRSILELLDPNRPRPGQDTAPTADATPEPPEPSAGRAVAMAVGDPPPPGDAEIDLLVVHTAPALAFAGGQAALVATVDAMIDHANAVFSNSAVPAHYRLVNIVEGAFLAEQDPGNNVIGPLVQLSALRMAHAADLVAVLVRDMAGNRCGIAPSNPVAAGLGVGWFAFELEIHSPCYLFDTFAHEGGHLLGLNHDPATQLANGDAPSAVPYAQGHTVPGVFGTIMSYATLPIPDFFDPRCDRCRCAHRHR